MAGTTVVGLLLVLICVGNIQGKSHGVRITVDCSGRNLKKPNEFKKCVDDSPLKLNDSPFMLNLSNTKLTELDVIRYYKHYYNVVELDLTDNKFSQINTTTFKGMSELKTVNLSRNALHTLTSDVFPYLQNVITLRLSRNNITNIAFITNASMCSLTLLDMSINKVSQIGGDELLKCPNLSNLNLSGNSIAMFKYLSSESLETLDLSLTGIREHGLENFNKTPNLVSLYLSGNNITSLSEAMFSGLNALERLDLSRNGLTNLAGKVFSVCPTLQSVDLSHNEIASIDPDVFNASMHNNPTFHIKGTKCSKYPPRKPSSNITHLDLSYNQLNVLDLNVFSVLEKLSQLDVSHNSVSAFSPDWVCLMFNVSVNLAGNPFDCRSGQLCDAYAISKKTGFEPRITCNDTNYSWENVPDSCNNTEETEAEPSIQIARSQQDFYIILSAYVFLLLTTIIVVMVISCFLGEPQIDERWWEDKIPHGGDS